MLINTTLMALIVFAMKSSCLSAYLRSLWSVGAVKRSFVLVYVIMPSIVPEDQGSSHGLPEGTPRYQNSNNTMGSLL